MHKPEQRILTRVKELEKVVSKDLGFKIPGIIAFCLFVIGYFFYKEYQKKQPEIIHQNILNKSFSGVVDSTFTVHMNHGLTTIIFKNKKSISGLQQHYYYMIKKNDSIVKRKGEDSIYIYRNGEVKTYKY
ncbi:hypothetical protein ACP3T3_06270 [Chryseobacterium sp. CBSDS_008]|uniref:hypothetical protein n=1 Tax=Chryseobacterium sp. CBSDS_008 TaxID=3415265 RepID=UPI003CF22EC2